MPKRGGIGLTYSLQIVGPEVKEDHFTGRKGYFLVRLSVSIGNSRVRKIRNSHPL